MVLRQNLVLLAVTVPGCLTLFYKNQRDKNEMRKLRLKEYKHGGWVTCDCEARLFCRALVLVPHRLREMRRAGAGRFGR